MKISISGSGYVGLVTAVILANSGHKVVCVDIDEDKIDKLNSGVCTIYEAGLEELLHKNKERLFFTSDYRTAYSDVDVIFIAVGTPEKADGSANMVYVNAVCRQIGESVMQDCVVVVKSTVPIGTGDKIEKHLKAHLKNDVNVEVVSNPEFLSQGTAVRDMLYGSRIIVGAESENAKKVMRGVYQNFESELVLTDRRSAEMTKYASNDFLALKISYINEIANLCERLGANVVDVARGMGLDPRIGNQFLKAGIGYGGSCFPKDTKALHWLGNYHDYELKTIKAAIEVNSNQKLILLKKAKKYYESFEGLTVAVLGLAFKPETDDLREAPSLYNIPILLDDGAHVKAWDPCAAEHFKKDFPQIEYCSTIEETIRDADICLIFTEWKDVLDFPLASFKGMRAPIILDGRNCFDVKAMSEYDYDYESIGRKAVHNFSKVSLADRVK